MVSGSLPSTPATMVLMVTLSEVRCINRGELVWTVRTLSTVLQSILGFVYLEMSTASEMFLDQIPPHHPRKQQHCQQLRNPDLQPQHGGDQQHQQGGQCQQQEDQQQQHQHPVE